MHTTIRDRAVDAYLDYYTYAPSNFLGELIEGRYTQGFRRRLTKRWKAGELHRPKQQDNPLGQVVGRFYGYEDHVFLVS
jgi:hypothetical protein